MQVLIPRTLHDFVRNSKKMVRTEKGNYIFVGESRAEANKQPSAAKP